MSKPGLIEYEKKMALNYIIEEFSNYVSCWDDPEKIEQAYKYLDVLIDIRNSLEGNDIGKNI